MACLGEGRSGCREMAKMNSGESGWLIFRLGEKWDLGGELWEEAACCTDLPWVVLSQGGACGLVSEGC